MRLTLTVVWLVAVLPRPQYFVGPPSILITVNPARLAPCEYPAQSGPTSFSTDPEAHEQLMMVSLVLYAKVI